MTKLTLTYLGTYWEWSGDLYYLRHEDGRHARVFVDSIGETWVDVRRVPDDGWFPTERVDSWRALNGAERAVRDLREQGFGDRRTAQFAHRVRERSL